MIPIQLTLRNFMSYGDERTTLEFAGMHVACLCGDNGNGKSALLDAMTYALWGRTRASLSQASGEDDLIRLGAEEMEVQLDFRLGEDQFRVVRKRSRKNRSGDWQLLTHGGEQTWRPVGGTGMRETERHLARLLRMEYETFLNSAYFQQGRADEFTRQKPDARKRILADILDLKRYERLEEMARERRTATDLAAKDLEGEIRHLETRAAETPAIELQLATQMEAIERQKLERESRESALSMALSQVAALDEKALRLHEREERLKDVEKETAEAETRRASLIQRLAQIDALLAGRERISAEYQQLLESRKRLESMESAVKELHETEQKRGEAQRSLDSGRHAAQRELDRLEAEWKAVEQRQAQIRELVSKIAKNAPEIAGLGELEKSKSAMMESLNRADQEFAHLRARHKQLEEAIHEVGEVLDLLSQPKSACPVCESDLSGGRQKTVIEKQEAKRAQQVRDLEEVKKLGTTCKRDCDALRDKVDSLDNRIRQLTAIRAHTEGWSDELERLKKQNAVADGLRSALDAQRKLLKEEVFGDDIRAEIGRLDGLIAKLKGDLKEYETLRAQVRELVEQKIESRFSQLEQAEAGRPEVEKEINTLVSMLTRRAEQISVERAKLEALRTELTGIESARKLLAEAEIAFRKLDESLAAVQGQAERCRQQLDDCAAAKAQAATKNAERQRILKEKQAWTELAAAFGKKGVQALIIDNALPEIQDEANNLLARMTDNAMRVSLSTLREAKSRSGSIETLDIAITDDAGTRPYEMFSGGEAFRVNFAIRIALSRLLARRAGAQLETLIIDEGFGTQDAKGRERLVEAIESVKDDFKLILVISHIEELKDAFPTRIEVTKTAAGSQISLLD